ncbi:MAG: aminotransferase class I/II-fold pyridoxal phosphate-dependent enzyme [Actinomycetota bacterium]
MVGAAGFVPPPYPYDRLDALRATADRHDGGIVDCSIGTPCDPVPEVAVDAAAAALGAANGYPPSAGTGALREAAAGWIDRRFGVGLPPSAIGACVGTKELVASLPHLLRLRNPDRDTVLYPAVAYPTYEMGAILAGLRPVPVPVDADWHLDLDAIDPADAARALLLWINEPGNPAGQTADAARFGRYAEWGRRQGVVVASDECYVEFAPTPATILAAGVDGVLAVHSVSKRSNLAGMRVGFYAGDPALVEYLVETRKHAGLMAPSPVQAAATAALGDDDHVEIQRARYRDRRAMVLAALRSLGLVHSGGDMAFYLWLRAATPGGPDGWALAAGLAAAGGLLVAPGDLYGAAGSDHVRLALVQPDDAFERVCARLEQAAAEGAMWTTVPD